MLQDTDTGVGLVVLTDSNGNYEFYNTPTGNFQIVEAFETLGGDLSPGDFKTAVTIETPIPKDPNIISVSGLPKGTTRIQSLSPNTIFVIVGSNDITKQDFLDSPVQDIPAEINNYGTIEPNIITEAANGTWGFLPNGTQVETSPAIEPYQNINSSFTYVQYTNARPADGSYSVSNIIANTNFGTWWNLADHNTGDETGRFAIINGDFPGQSFFSQKVSIIPNKQYVFSTWVCNLDTEIGSVLPKFSINIRNIAGAIILSISLFNNLEITSIPTWNQVGAIVDIVNDSEVIVEFISEGSAAGGNDFAIDDISLKAVEPAPVTILPKVADKDNAGLGDIITYTLIYNNPGPATVRDAIFQDYTAYGTTFVSNSLTINGVASLEDPNYPGVDIGTLVAGEVKIIIYKVRVNETLPPGNIIDNEGFVSYNFLDAVGNTVSSTVKSNVASVNINDATLISINQ